MVKRGLGGVINVASVIAFQPAPMMAVYAATKAYVLSFSEAIANELREHGVTVTCLCPGYTNTSFFDDMEKGGGNMLARGADPMDVARLGLRGLRAQKSVVVYGFGNKVNAFLVRLVPRRLVTWVVRKMLSQSTG